MTGGKGKRWERGGESKEGKGGDEREGEQRRGEEGRRGEGKGKEGRGHPSVPSVPNLPLHHWSLRFKLAKLSADRVLTDSEFHVGLSLCAELCAILS